MSKKNLKKFAAVTLAATMVFGSTVAVFAEGEGDSDSTAGVAEGTGSYEGGEMKYPTLSVTLPTIDAGTYDYIADPNGLIEATDEAKYQGYTFTGNGIFFLTDDAAKTYTDKSKAITLINENAQDIDVTVKLEQKTAGSSIIQYADSATFADDDTVNKLYLAITDDATTDAKVAALTATGAATLKTTVAGVPGNYKAAYDSSEGKYGYTKKDEADLTDWNDCSFTLTGAINKKATWGDDVEFPQIKVTWSYAEHRDSALSASTISATSNVLTVTDATVTKAELIKVGATASTSLTKGTHYTTSGDKITFTSNFLNNNKGGSLKITLSTGAVETVTIE